MVDNGEWVTRNGEIHVKEERECGQNCQSPWEGEINKCC